MALFVRQIWTLTVKNILIALVRHWFSTPIRAFVLPVVFVALLSYARNLFIPPSVYGIGRPSAVRSLSSALEAASGGRNKLVFVNNGFQDGDIQAVINDVISQAKPATPDILVLEDEQELLTVCRSTIRGTSTCLGGAVFFSSPTEGPGDHWNYTIRADGALESKIVVNTNKNDAEIYVFPLQRAIDTAIARRNGTSLLPDTVEEYAYTSETAAQRKDQIRVRYMGGIIDILAVAFFIGIVPVTYQLTGLIATEREIGMAQLLDCMMPNQPRWQPQAARIVANHLSFDLIYAPGWIVGSIILSVGVFTKTNAAIVIIFNILAGLSTSSVSIFGAAFFRKAQLSGITMVISCLLLAVISQVAASKASTGPVAVLSLLFPPMNYVYFTMLMARFERQDVGTSMTKSAPNSTFTLPGIVFWIFALIHIVVFPLLGALVERSLYGTADSSRKTSVGDSDIAVTLDGFTKQYKPTLLTKCGAFFTRSPTKSVVAVDNFSLSAHRGQIMVLLGANGSGKSTSLDAIAGLSSITRGSISITYPDTQSGFGMCPQKNVLWEDLTVQEHVSIFNKIKAIGARATKHEIRDLLGSCDIDLKTHARSKTLSGGQKRKLQLAMMFTGGSSVCCVDEVSSGLDPLSRRKIWDILLAERGRRSIIFTTHFLDEADLLADHIAVLSRGVLKASGTSVQLKHSFGSGYRVHVYEVHGGVHAKTYDDVSYVRRDDQTIYMLTDSAATSAFLARIEQDGVSEYQVSGPTIEDVFLKVAEEVKDDTVIAESWHSPTEKTSDDEISVERTQTPPDVSKTATVALRETSTNKTAELVTGRRISLPRQTVVLFMKRLIIFRRNPLPYIAALLIPIVAAGLVTLFLTNFQKAGCTPTSDIYLSDIESLSAQDSYSLVFGPRSKISQEAMNNFAATVSAANGGGYGANISDLTQAITFVDSLQDFNTYINTFYANVTPGGFYLGDESSPATFAWRGDSDISSGFIIQNALNIFATNISIGTQYQAFDEPWGASVGKALQMITYFGLAMAVYPAFFALYPTIERIRNVRGLHFSNGVRSGPLWLAYLSFDFVIVLLSSAICVIIFSAASNIWYHVEYLFLVFFLYGLASTLLAYVISLFSASQLAAFAFAAGGQAVMYLIYFVAYMSALTYSAPNKIDSNVNLCHFTIAAISPIGNILRAMYITLNTFSITCRDRELAPYPGAITAYGGPILYLILQSFFLFGLLLFWDSGKLSRLWPKKREVEVEAHNTLEPEISKELGRVTSSHDGLRVLNLTRQFKSNLAVDNVTFGVPRGEVFALLGPNGAGKSTTISMIRGDIQPSRRGGEILVEDISVIKHRAQARSRLGVCPQFDAIDTMTVQEHLYFYALVRGVQNPRHNVTTVLKAVGLQNYADRMAAKLSGGNKRKLSLGIALMGNPSVLLLDEPSSGMDAASKRVMWRTLASVVPGRSLVLTTHSMEEADALADRAGIMAGKMLALGTTDHLRRKHGNKYYVHLVHKNAPHTTGVEMERIRGWVTAQFPSAEIERKTYSGQLRFSVPVGGVVENEKASPVMETVAEEKQIFTDEKGSSSDLGMTRTTTQGRGTTISALFTLLERNKVELQVEYYSVSRATLDQVFLSIVGKHNVEEEGHQAGNQEKVGEGEKARSWWPWNKGRQ